MSKRKAIKRIIESSDNTAGKIFTFTIQFLIIVSLVTFSIDTFPDLTPRTKDILDLIEIIIAIFTLEFIFRLIVAEKITKFVFSFYGLVDLAAILPFYIAYGLDLRAVRIFRLLRLVRVLKLFKYS